MPHPLPRAQYKIHARAHALPGIDADDKEEIVRHRLWDLRFQTLATPLHLLATFFTPRYFWKEGDLALPANTIIAMKAAARRLILRMYPPGTDMQNEVHEKAMLQLRDYEQHDPSKFPALDALKSIKSITTQPFVFWKMYGYDVPELCRIAMRVTYQAASSSACERNWSMFDFIVSKHRNRLHPKKQTMPVRVMSNLRFATQLVKQNTGLCVLKGGPHWLIEAPAGGEDAPVYAEEDELNIALDEVLEQLIINDEVEDEVPDIDALEM
jgi:hypothetical protein